MTKKLTNSEAKEKVKQAHNGEIELLSQYSRANDKHCFRCSKGHEWLASFNNVANNASGCPKCSSTYAPSTNEAKERILQVHNGEIELISDYTTSGDKHLFACSNGHNFRAIFRNVANNASGCPKCSGLYIPTNEEYREEAISLGYEPIDVYINSKTKIKHKCLTCGYVWKIAPTTIKTTHGCPKCSNNYIPTNEEYREEAISLGYEPIDVYINSMTKIRHKCLECDHVWSVAPNTMKSAKSGCPKCSNKNKAENLVNTYLESVYPNQFQAQKRLNGLVGVNGGQLSFDFHLEIGSNRYLIEIQGSQHFQPSGWNPDYFPIQQEHDLRKYNYARNHGYMYIAIPNTCSTAEKESTIIPFLQNAIWLSETFGIQSHGFHLENHLEYSSDTQEITQTALF